MKDDRKMRLGLSMRYLGYHIAAWRHPGFRPAALVDFSAYLDVARQAEAEKLDMIFFADGLGIRADDAPKGALCRDMKNAELEPITLLSAIAACTDRIGLVATASTTYNEPFHIARKYASLDHISRGRAGWNIVTSWSDQEARNFNRVKNLEKDARYARAAEFVEVVTGLWDSWEPDAFVHDKASGIFYDPEKLHVLDHQGPHFSVRGPLNSCATPQGRPVIVQAGASAAGRDIAARFADVVYSVAFTIEEARSYYADLKARAVAQGRAPGSMAIMPGITLYTGATRAEAQARFDELQSLIDPLVGLAIIHRYCGDLSGHDIDGPLPRGDGEGLVSIGRTLLAAAHEEGLSIRQFYERAAAANSGHYLIGTAEEIVDELQAWFETGAADGFNFCPPLLPQGMEDLSRFILPELRRRGLFRTSYEGTTLRANLGLTATG